ncbi:glutathione S-transferase 1-like [Aedes albopictus]|uniref:glutathione transferase n=1 Tax=Aedes albopictus TaxID=7160 RepID=A0ABM1YR58_AEDAL|nr:glutathione S-transferase 1-like [Aedes albopictus]
MGKIKLYSFPLSPPGRTVQLTAKALGLELEFHSVSVLAKEHLTDEFIKMNPLHTIPVIDDNGFVLYDSHAIAVYLISKYSPGNPLYPTSDLEQQARINAILHFESGVMFARLRYVGDAIQKAAQPGQVPQDRVEYALQAVDQLEALLRDGPYLAGDHVTLADVSCVTSFSFLDVMLPVERAKYPKVYGWYERMKRIQGYDEINQTAVDQLNGVIQGIFEANKEK